MAKCSISFVALMGWAEVWCTLATLVGVAIG